MSYNRRSVLGLIASAGVLSTAPHNTAGKPATTSSNGGVDEGSPKPAQADTVAPPAPSLQFRDQETDGGAVVVATATLADAGFVVILRDDEIVGVSAYLSAGEYEDLEIAFDRPLLETSELTATIQTDTNGNRTFDATRVKLACSQRDEESAVVSETATVTLPRYANLVFEDQTVDESFVIESATLPDGGWISLFAPRVDDPHIEEVFEIGGTSFLEPGHYEALTFDANFPTKPGECSARIIALVIDDVNGNGEYEFEYHFPGPDYPSTGRSAVITKANCPSE